jgi:hypothetical protein
VRDIGAIIWGILVVIGVISSIVQSAKRARQTSVAPRISTSSAPSSQSERSPERGVAAPSRRAPQLAAMMAQFERDSQNVAQAAAPPPPPQPKPKAPKPAPPAAVVAPAQLQPQVRRGGFASFGDRDSLIRAIVAAEVLGKPLALRDE